MMPGRNPKFPVEQKMERNIRRKHKNSEFVILKRAH